MRAAFLIKNMAASSYFLLSRSIIESKIWKESPELLKLFIYLLSEARFTAEPKQYPNFELKRGEVLTSLSQISDDNEFIEQGRVVKWSRAKVSRLLTKLQQGNYIELLADTFGTHISICNYSHYQNPENYRADRDETHLKRIRNASETHVNITNKDNNGNNGNNGNKLLPPSEAENSKTKNPTLQNCIDSLPILHFQSNISIEAMTLWFESRKQKRKPITPLVLQILIDRIKNWTPERFMEAVKYSVEYIKLIEPPNNANKRQFTNDEIIEALNVQPEDFYE